MSSHPLRIRALRDGAALFVGDNGRFFRGGEGFVERFANAALDAGDIAFLRREGHWVEAGDLLGEAGYLYALSERIAHADGLDYLILVPTLRCNLGCSYCQVSRAPAAAVGFDWSDAVLGAVLATLDRLDTEAIKIEFQGGEPTLRPDLMRAVIERAERFAHRQFVVCTNLQRLDDEILAIFDRDDVCISTSLDGDAAVHGRNRTGEGTPQFLANLALVIQRYGPHKVSALPTIDPTAPPDVDTLIDAYAAFGLHSVYLRPINYQGFARKRHAGSRQAPDAWRDYYERFVRRLIARNWSDRSQVFEESYLSICLRRIFQPGRDRHVDLRNPNPVGLDYIVVDHDGTVYPTDEARMLSRSGVIDLSIGDVFRGWASEQRELLNAHATNESDPACSRCAYQPYCGRDLVDDIARYGRIDLPRHETEFCRRHLHLFDLAFQLLGEDDPAVRYSLARWLRLDGTPDAFGALHR